MNMKWMFASFAVMCLLKSWFGAPTTELREMFRLIVLVVSFAAYSILDKQDDIAKAIEKRDAEF
jgi:phosphate uptake regulator